MKVHITGLGIVTPLGNSIPSVFQSLLDNKSAVRSYPEWRQYKGLHSYVGAPAAPYSVSSISRQARRTMSRMSEMASVATLDALAQAQLNPEVLNAEFPRVALIMGSTSGSPYALESYYSKFLEVGGPEGQLGTSFFKVMNHSVSTNVAAALGFTGPALGISSACATSAQAIVMGWELIQSGLYDLVIAGGADELHHTSAAVFDTVMAASRNFNDDPEKASRPFHAQRDGLVVAEGAGICVLESARSVERRKIQSLAMLNSGAFVCEGSHVSQSNKSAMIKTMDLALKRAEVPPETVEYVNAHATGTLQGDSEEAQAIAEFFGHQKVPVSSLKGHFGHTLAACGGIELALSIEMMNQGQLIPTRNLDQLDPACVGADIFDRVIPKPLTRVLSNNFAFGGISTSLLITKTESPKYPISKQT